MARRQSTPGTRDDSPDSPQDAAARLKAARAGRRSTEQGPARPTRAATNDDSDDAEHFAELPSTANLGRETEEGLGYGRDDGPESQGQFAGDAFGDSAQGTSGDEDYDVSYGPTGMAGPEEVEPSERGADTPDEEPWELVGDPDEVVADDERDVATGDAAVEPVAKRVRRSRTARPDDRIREDIEDAIAEVVDPVDVTIEVVRGEVALEGVVETADLRDEVEACAQSVDGVRAIDNRLEIRVDPEEEG
ncbi:MAG TPA: BON domain-containing protein [Candidatus Binatia bacterium]|nr:BON domain-containing protein [Candidatus Binatia bacterium]